MSAKLSLYQFIEEKLQALQVAAIADPNSVEAQSPLLGAKHRYTDAEITGEDDWGLHYSNVISAPRPNGEGVTVEWDARLILTTYVRVIAEPDRDERYEESERAKAMALEIAGYLWADTGLGGRTCNTFVGQLVDGRDSLSHGQAHEVVNLYITVNQSGAPLPGLWGSL